MSFIHRVCAYHARNLDLGHILNIKNAGVLLKRASFRGNLMKCASFRYEQWNGLAFVEFKRIMLVLDANEWGVLVFAQTLTWTSFRGNLNRTSFRKGRRYNVNIFIYNIRIIIKKIQETNLQTNWWD